MKNWVIEGRKEGKEWKEIDRHDNYDLNGYYYQHYYSISEKTEPFQLIRIKCIGKDHRSFLNNLEIFGEISQED